MPHTVVAQQNQRMLSLDGLVDSTHPSTAQIHSYTTENLAKEKLGVDRETNGDEEQPKEQPTKRDNVGLDLVPVLCL